MLHEEREIPELYFLKHRHDDDKDWADYENNMLDNMISPYAYQNDLMFAFLKRLQPLTAKMFDQMNVMKNFRNYIVDKYHYKQAN
jgi:hypothetical protein